MHSINTPYLRRYWVHSVFPQLEGGVLLACRCTCGNHNGHNQDAGDWSPHLQGADHHHHYPHWEAFPKAGLANPWHCRCSPSTWAPMRSTFERPDESRPEHLYKAKPFCVAAKIGSSNHQRSWMIGKNSSFHEFRDQISDSLYYSQQTSKTLTAFNTNINICDFLLLCSDKIRH